jgi:hypothetical protein
MPPGGDRRGRRPGRRRHRHRGRGARPWSVARPAGRARRRCARPVIAVAARDGRA